MFQLINTFRHQNFGKTWQESLKNKEMIKNSYRVQGDLHMAKTFVKTLTNYQPHTHFEKHGEHIIFSANIALAPSYGMKY